jgi:hypothetical protein
MKKRAFFKPAALCCTIASLLFIFTMCKKDNDDSTPGTSYRITADSMYFNDTLAFTGKITYNGNLLTEMVYYLLGIEEYMKEGFQYSGNSISSVTEYMKTNGVWKKQMEYEITGYNGDNPTAIIIHSYNESGVETYKYKTEYFYQGSVLQKTLNYYDESGGWTLVGGTSYKYDTKGRIIQEMEDTTLTSYAYLTSYTYVGDNMNEALTQEYSYGILVNDYKITFEYVSGRLSKAIDYDWGSGNWMVDGQTQYEYNAAGNLAVVRFAGNYGTYKNEYSYDKGSGNYRQCVKSMGEAPFPGDPTPYPVKPNGSPSLMQYLKK